MKYLFFDTETTGVPKNYRAPLTDSENWPRLVQLAFILAEDDGKTITTYLEEVFIVKPHGFEIPEEASKIHGITNEQAITEGMSLDFVISQFKSALNNCDIIVGHNISFDRKIIGAEMLRLRLEDSLHGKPRICTMHKSTKYCAIPNKHNRGLKCPRLEELYMKLFNKKLLGAHDAYVDIEATMQCFFELRERDVISTQDVKDAILKFSENAP